MSECGFGCAAVAHYAYGTLTVSRDEQHPPAGDLWIRYTRSSAPYLPIWMEILTRPYRTYRSLLYLEKRETATTPLRSLDFCQSDRSTFSCNWPFLCSLNRDVRAVAPHLSGGITARRGGAGGSKHRAENQSAVIQRGQSCTRTRERERRCPCHQLARSMTARRQQSSTPLTSRSGIQRRTSPA
jgi:hypothetical protein